MYRGDDNSLARPWKETSYSGEELQHYNKTYGVQTTAIYCCCLYAVNLGIAKEYTIFSQTQHLLVLLQRHFLTRTSHHQASRNMSL